MTRASHWIGRLAILIELTLAVGGAMLAYRILHVRNNTLPPSPTQASSTLPTQPVTGVPKESADPGLEAPLQEPDISNIANGVDAKEPIIFVQITTRPEAPIQLFPTPKVLDQPSLEPETPVQVSPVIRDPGIPVQVAVETENSIPSTAEPEISAQATQPVSNDAQHQDDQTPTRLVIPTIGLDAPVEAVGWHLETQNSQQVSVWDVPNHFAAGWLKTSAPVGVPGNTVLEGHHNIYGEVFKNLVNLQPGDTITLHTASNIRPYRVNQKLILEEAGQPLEVRQTNAQYIHHTSDERLTLVTCWPYTGNSHRLIIIAFPIPR